MLDDLLKRYSPGLAQLLRRSARDLVLVTTVGISGVIGCNADRGTVAYGPPPVQDAAPDATSDGASHTDGAPARDAWLDAMRDGGDSGTPIMYGPVAYGPPPMQDAGVDATQSDAPMAAYGPIAYGPPIPSPDDPGPTGWYGR